MYTEIFKITSLKGNVETGNGSRVGLTLKLTLMRCDDKVFFSTFFLAKINETKILFVFQEITLQDEKSFLKQVGE